jgi:hypothetical protein
VGRNVDAVLQNVCARCCLLVVFLHFTCTSHASSVCLFDDRCCTGSFLTRACVLGASDSTAIGSLRACSCHVLHFISLGGPRCKLYIVKETGQGNSLQVFKGVLVLIYLLVSRCVAFMLFLLVVVLI